MKAQAIILGSGNSTGVPAIGNVWGACDPIEPRNRRTRTSCAIQTSGTTLIIDTGPDFRDQLNRENISNIDGVLYTHGHGDHVNGIDELRLITYRNKKLTPVYGNKETLEDLKLRFNYMFDGGQARDLYPPMLESREIKPEFHGKTQKFNDIPYVPFEQDHGTCKTLGYRFGNFAYSADLWRLDDPALEILQGIDAWVVDAAGYKQRDNKVHASLETVFKLNKTIKAKKVFLTSLSLTMDYQTLLNELPEGFEPAYDGLRIPIEWR